MHIHLEEKGGGVASNEIELYEIAGRGIAASLVGQILVEEYVGNWKQIEYEVMQDYSKNNVIVCNMEKCTLNEGFILVIT